MGADIQLGSVQLYGAAGTVGHGFVIIVRGQTVASVVYQKQVEAQTARDTIEEALAGVIEATPQGRP